VGIDTCDDAGVYRLSDEVALVQTVDFITPVVDDPFQFGQIAAANSLSDVYAMGGRPLTAMNVAGFPSKKLDRAILAEILKGGGDKVREAGAVIVGGHTVEDEELKYGLSVTGLVHPGRVITNQAAEPGDALLLTKPLGTGLVSTAGKRGKASRESLDAATASMLRLNRDACAAMIEAGARAATDITGFGFLGHAMNLARGSGVRVAIELSALPLLPGAMDLARRGMSPGGTAHNRDYYGPMILWPKGLDEAWARIAFDPQTSGGLLIAIPEARLETLVSALGRRDVAAHRVGWVEARAEPGTFGRLVLRESGA
jgi:selenide,water dikinase